jgi:hypothetical protein
VPSPRKKWGRLDLRVESLLLFAMAIASAVIALLVSVVLYLVVDGRTRSDGIPRVSLLEHLHFVLEDLLPRGRGQAPLLRKLHTKYGSALSIGSLYSFGGSGVRRSDQVHAASELTLDCRTRLGTRNSFER